MELIENFYKKDKYFEALYNSYKNKLDYFYDQAERQTVRKEYARGGEIIHRGFYCPSTVQDIIIGNCKRGKLVKKPRKTPDYEYWFDDNDRLILVKQLCTYDIKISPTIELLFYNGRTVNSVLYQKDKFDSEGEIRISSLSKCIYENGLIKNYDFANIFVDPLEDRTEMFRYLNKICPKINEELAKGLKKSEFLRPYVREFEFDKNNCNSAKICNEILTENFEYNDTVLVSSTLESYNFDVNIISQSKYFYNYDDNKKMISYTAEEYDNGKRIPSVWDDHIFLVINS